MVLFAGLCYNHMHKCDTLPSTLSYHMHKCDTLPSTLYTLGHMVWNSLCIPYSLHGLQPDHEQVINNPE